MNAIDVREMGVKFKLRHQKTTTLRETVINLFTRRRNRNPSFFKGNEDFWALRNVTFTVEEGEFLAVIGRNGAGKSTLLQILTGIYKPDKGYVEKKGRVGLLQIGTGFHPELPGRDNIYLSGAMLGLRKKEVEAVFSSIVAFSELERFIDTPVKNYSSGMLSRLGFAIAINIKPDILLIDEVLSVGDEAFRQKSRQKLDEIREMGKTIVMVTHSLGEVRKNCDRAICLDHGQLVFQGKGADAVDFYLEKFSQ